MIKYVFPVVMVLLLTSCGPSKQVAATHPNGNPEVVVYMKGKGAESEKVKEKVYYENGKLEYVGNFKDGVEHGEWIYYYEDGTKESLEHWENGLEQGVHYEYMPDGQVRRELHYDKGKLIKTVDPSDAP